MRFLCLVSGENTRRKFGDHFRARGVAVDFVEMFDELESALLTARYDSAVFDFSQIEAEAPDVLRGLRNAAPQTVMALLSGESTSDQRVASLNRWADAVFPSTIDGSELDARLRALVRLASSGTFDTKLSCGNVQLDPTTIELWVGGRAVNMPRRELSMLSLLLRRRGRVISKVAAEQALYEFGQEVTPNSIEVSVCRLRKALKHSGATVEVRTLRGIGYVLDSVEPA